MANIQQASGVAPRYRLFVDEVGNADLQASVNNPNHRYLSLTGIIFELEQIRGKVGSELEYLKEQCFGLSVNNPIVLHRKELVRQKYPFNALQDPLVEAKFNQGLLQLLQEWDYRVITIVIDKLDHLRRYKVWQAHPYHYCLQVMLERYVRWLKSINAVGDVLAESRGGKADKTLKLSFQRLYRLGTTYVSGDIFATHLTSSELKLKRKIDNDPGLQIADLIAHPSYRCMKMQHEKIVHPEDFGAKIVKILREQKYYRDKQGKINGYGQKWLP